MLYHLVHTCALGLSAFQFHGRKRTIVSSLFLAGLVGFSGSCYMIVLLNERSPYAKITPYGGMSLIAGWLAFAFL